MDVIESKHLPDRDGFQLVASKMVDYDSTPYEADCYDDADIAAWRNDEWRYVGVVVKAYRQGIELGSDFLWGVEDGYSPGWDGYVDAFDHTLGDFYDLPGEAIAAAKDALLTLCACAR